MVYVCPDKDIECGNWPANWCRGCPKRGMLQVAVAPHAAAHAGPTAMRPATAEEAAAMAQRFRPSGSDWVAVGGFLEDRRSDGSTRWSQVSPQYENDPDVVTLYRKRAAGVLGLDHQGFSRQPPMGGEPQP